jgi:hypothetical protein
MSDEDERPADAGTETDEAQVEQPSSGPDETTVSDAKGEPGAIASTSPRRFSGLIGRLSRVPWSKGASTVLTVVLTLASVAVGAWVTYKTNNETISAQREQSVEQFAREHRQEVYATILKQATNVANASSFNSSAFGAIGQLSLGAGAAKTGQPLTVPADPDSGLSISPGRSPINEAAKEAEDAKAMAEMANLQGNLGVVRNTWQGAYTALDQAISDAEIFSTDKVINLARALRDKYRDEYYRSLLKQLESLSTDKKPGGLDPKLADALVGVAPSPPGSYDPALLSKSTYELTGLFVEAAQDDLELHDAHKFDR